MLGVGILNLNLPQPASTLMHSPQAQPTNCPLHWWRLVAAIRVHLSSEIFAAPRFSTTDSVWKDLQICPIPAFFDVEMDV